MCLSSTGSYCLNLLDLPEEAYEMFTPTKEYGKLYMNYPHVGKEIMGIYQNYDVDIPADQIMPTSILKNDLFLNESR